MENIALYTKYRPQKFSEILGQDHITSVLAESAKNGNISHAYLFTGSRGTGKTSIARILAREIGTSDNDLFEIDAASNTSVDNIRDLNESVNIAPFDSKYKVYILDEVHMLSKSAFNALLKTLEEPPKHVVFILATTEPHKVIDTIASRCETYNFRTPNREILKKLVVKTAKNEGVELEGPAAELIAILGDGSFRDTHTILQKLLRTKSGDKKITMEEVEQVTGAPKSELVRDVIDSVVRGEMEKGLGAIKFANDNNLDAKIFTRLILEKFRALLLKKVAPNKKDLFEDSILEEEVKWFDELLKDFNENVNSKVLLELLKASGEVNNSALPYLPLEIFIVEIVSERG